MSELPVTVLMPVYNSQRYLRAAMQSILTQTCPDFEFLIVNDGSTDDTRGILEEYRDPRVRVIDTENRGVAAALRFGVELARGAYIARMDADDESLPDRLKLEKRCLDAHPGVVVVHGRADYIDAAGAPVYLQRDEGHSNIATKWLLNWRNVPLHSTVMMRAATLRKHGLNYRLEMNRAEDFDLWNRLARVGDFMYLPETVLRYRVHAENISNSTPADLQFDAQGRVIEENFRRLGVELSPETARELVVISGAARIDPVAYRYRNLDGNLHRLLAAVAAGFCETFAVNAHVLAATQARQLVRWARYMLDTSRGYAAKLLLLSVRKRKVVVFSRRFWAVLGGLMLPASWVMRAASIRQLLMH